MTMRNDESSGHGARPFPTKPESEVDDELAFHVEERVREYIARGMTPEAARTAARERFGNVGDVRRECAQLLTEDRRAEARRNLLDDLGQDLRFALRSAVRAPMFTVLAVVTLALGIGANAAVFGVVKSVLLNSLQYGDPDRLVRIYSPFKNGAMAHGALSAGTVSDINERQRSFSSLGAFTSPRDVIYMGDDGPRVMKMIYAQPAFFRTLGVSPVRGPGFTEEDAVHDTAYVVLLPHATWQRLFAGDSSVIGRRIQVNGIARTVVGVLPRSFTPLGEEADFYFPLGFAAPLRDPIGARGSHSYGLVGRLKAGVSADAAQRELTAIAAELERLYAKDNLGIGLSATPLRDALVGDTRGPLLVLLASAALVLLITCANLAGALLSRTISRRKEFAVRVALGAGRGRLVRQLLTESVLLALAGGMAGLLLATVGLRMLRGLAISALPPYADLSLDGGAVAVTFALALATGLAFGVAPALSVGRADPQGTLRDETRGTSESRRSRNMRGMLVAGQIALCVSLLAAAGLLARSLWAMTSAPAGFMADGLLTVTVPLPNSQYGTVESRVLIHDQLSERLRTIPGVSGVAIVSALPTTVSNSNGLFIQDKPWGADEPVPFVLTVRASDDYFATMGIPLKQGRTFTTADRVGAPVVMVINEAMAKKYWPAGGAVGARIHIGPPDPTEPWIEVIGVVGDVRNDPASLRPEPMMYPSLRQSPFGDTYVLRTAGDPLALTGSVRSALAAVDPTLPMHKLSTVRTVLDNGLAARRLPVVLMTAFGALALLLASVGVYAMFASMAAAREREFGVRVALGSSRGAIAGLVLRQGGVWMVAGLIVGSVGIALAGRLVQSMLYGVAPFDVLTLSGAVVTLFVCAMVALLVPVRRAMQVDPITVLR
ncbi:MAG: permease [Gemmatimonadetes bacterium]|nr:permease [Gemmatimonadota bacterium]